MQTSRFLQDYFASKYELKGVPRTSISALDYYDSEYKIGLNLDINNWALEYDLRAYNGENKKFDLSFNPNSHTFDADGTRARGPFDGSRVRDEWYAANGLFRIDSEFREFFERGYIKFYKYPTNNAIYTYYVDSAFSICEVLLKKNKMTDF